MSCYSPLKAFQIGYNHKTHKPIYKITSFDVDHLENQGNMYSPKWIKIYDSQNNSPPKLGKYKTYVKNYIEIPCGKCIGCRLDYARHWANRCMLEMQYHESSYFLTLTYDDANVPRTQYVDIDTGELKDSQTLVKRDFQLFMKRLRDKYPYDNKLRYYMCGEYGSSTFRPHYHAIVFGLRLDDLVLYSRTPEGNLLYNSEFLNKLWPYGFVVVGNVTYESCSYVARYVMKKAGNDLKSQFELMNMEPEFTLMSRKPGIARQYFDDHPDLFDFEYINLSTESGGFKFKPPRYFARLQEEVDKDFMKRKKGRGVELAASTKREKLVNTTQNYQDLLNSEREAKEDQVKSLKRRLT